MRAIVRAAKALSDETRLRILNLLLERECCVCEVMRVLDISQTRASRNLNILYAAGFLKLRRCGLWAYYSIAYSALGDLAPLLGAVDQGLRGNRIAQLDRKRLLKDGQTASKACVTSPAAAARR
jgi:ArsR family transcriptional regulator, arsenate/arsenite/antimonite-responsive transcriptional repressor